MRNHPSNWLTTFLFLVLSVSCSVLSAGSVWESPAPGMELLFTNHGESLITEHPYVAVRQELNTQGESLISPDPNQLRVQDLRNNLCYPQPDALEVCGSGDTLAIMLYTKSVAPLQDIRVDVVFDDGIEYGGFAMIDNTLSNSGAELDTISTENFEAPSFLISEVSEPNGGVVLNLGIRAECGVDFSTISPNVVFQFSYTNDEGVLCTSEVTLESFGGNILTPRVIIGNTPPNTNLGRFNTNPCQSIDISQSTPDAAATGYIFRAASYGFEDGISISMVNIDGVAADPTTYTIEPTTGALELTVNNPTADGALDFNEVTTVQVCYTYSACFPNVDYFPEYSVVSACDGEFCTGPFNTRSSRLVSNFPQRPEFTAEFLNEMQPDLCNGVPYSFEILIGTENANPLDDQITDIQFDLRRCKISGISLASIEVLTPDGATVLGTLDEMLFSVRGTDAVNTNTGVPTLDRAGTIVADLRNNQTDFPGSGLVDLDGDGNFDDIAGGGMVRLRFVFPISCSSDELACNSSPDVPGGISTPDCQFNQIELFGRRACNSGAVSTLIDFGGTSLFTAASTAEFTNEESEVFTNRDGYNFGQSGATDDNDIDFRLESTKTLDFQYNLSESDLFNCPAANPSANASLVVKITGDEFIVDDFEFDNVIFDGVATGIAPVVDNTSEEGVVTVIMDGGSVVAGQDFTFSFDVSTDTARCSPAKLLFVDAFLVTECTNGCDCGVARACTSTSFRVDPDSIDCACTYTQSVEATRVSRGFTDNTRNTEIDADDVTLADNERFISGDTIELRHLIVLNGDQLPDFNEADRILGFRVIMRGDDNNNLNSTFPAMLDYPLQQVMEFNVIRPSTGETFDIGTAFSGLNHNAVRETGVTIGLQGTNVENRPFGFNTVEQPAFPNGGFNFGSGNTSADPIDGRYVGVRLRNLVTSGEFDAISVFFDAIGGSFVLGDTIEVVSRVPLVDNPGWDGISNRVVFDPVLDADAYIGNPADGARGPVSSGNCTDFPDDIFYASPTVTGESRIDYADDCEAELVVKFAAANIPAGWFTNEYRLVAGIEQFGVQIPFPYYYGGGATVETGGIAPFSVEPDSLSGVDTATIGGVDAFLPSGTFGTLYFQDAEFLDGVRPDGYAGWYQGDNDIRTIGGSFPMIGFQGGTDDSLVFRIPLLRACGAEPDPGLTMDFDAANKHLPDLQIYPHLRNNGYWDGLITGNEGQVVVPDGSNYLPFNRIDGTTGSTTDPVSRERQIANPLEPVVPDGLPGELTATTTIAEDFITDDVGTETNNFMLCPEAGEALAAGAVSIEVASSVDLISINSGAVTFTQALVTDTSTFYAVEIPAGLAVDECFSLDLETQLLFCDAGFVCIGAVLGCPGTTVPVEDQVAVAAEFMLDCGDLRKCYVYRAGSADLATAFNVPTQSQLCSVQSYSINYTNIGSGELQDFMPLLFLPAGLDFIPGTFTLTVVAGGAGTPISDPVQNAAENTVVGDAYVFDQAEIDALLANMVVEVGDVITLQFDAATSCDFVSGAPIGSAVNANSACDEPYSTPDEVSAGMRVTDPDAPAPMFELDLPDEIEISCSEEGTEILITAINVGKAPAVMNQVMFTLPTGFSVEPENFEVLAPSDFSITAADVTTTDLGGGITMYSFTGPDTIAVGGSFCVAAKVAVENLDCGEYRLGVAFKQTVELVCTTSGMSCDVASLLTESPFIDVIVVPAATIGEANVTAECGSTQGTFNIAYELEIEAPSRSFAGNAVVELFDDVDANGELDENIDVMLGMANNVTFQVDSGSTVLITGSFDDIDQNEVCPVLIRFSAPGCVCSESIIPVADILPEFVNNLGESVALCPGEEGMLTGICADLDYAFRPASAGTVTDNMDGTVSFMLAPGILQADLVVSGGFGSCPVNLTIPVETVEEFDFGPYEATVCSNGSQQVDLNIPVNLQEDLTVLITPSVGIEDPTSLEPTITNLQSDQVYDVEFTLNGTCMAQTTLSVTVEDQPQVELTGGSGCSTGFSLTDMLTISPANTQGVFTSNGDGVLSPDGNVPGDITYTPGPMDLQRGTVEFRFVTEDPDGPCGPSFERVDFTILLVDCGSFFWNGGNED